MDPELRRMFTAGRDQRLGVLELRSGEVVSLDVTTRSARKVALSRDALLVATCQRPGLVSVRGASAGELLASREVDATSVAEPVFRGDDKLEVGAGDEVLFWTWRS